MRQLAGQIAGAGEKSDALQRRPGRRIQPFFPRCAAKEAEARTGPRLHRERDIFQRAIFGQYSGDLERSRQSEDGARGHVERGDVKAGEIDSPRVGLQDAGDEVDQRRLAGPVGADQRDEPALIDAEAHVVGDGERAEALGEPFAGLGSDETRAGIDLIRALKSEYTMLLVEHDMDAVFALADEIGVLVNGRLIAWGTPPAIRADEGVRSAYLGEEALA